MQFQTQMICAALITIPSNRQTLSTLSVFIIPDSVRLCHQLSSVIGSLGPSTVFGYKGILLIFAFFWPMRGVRLKQVNGSRFYGISIYNVPLTEGTNAQSFFLVFSYLNQKQTSNSDQIANMH